MFMISRGFMTSFPSDTNCELVWVMPRLPWKLWKAILFSNGWLNHRGKSTEGRGPAARRHPGWSFQLPVSSEGMSKQSHGVMPSEMFSFSVLWILWTDHMAALPSPALAVAKLIPCFPWISSTNYWHQRSGLAQGLQVNRYTSIWAQSKGLKFTFPVLRGKAKCFLRKD